MNLVSSGSQVGSNVVAGRIGEKSPGSPTLRVSDHYGCASHGGAALVGNTAEHSPSGRLRCGGEGHQSKKENKKNNPGGQRRLVNRGQGGTSGSHGNFLRFAG